jgi:hypothetical protein
MLTKRVTHILALAALALALPTAAAAATPPSWSAPVEASGPGSDTYDPHLAVNAEGDAAAVWMGEGAGGGYAIQASTRPAGGTWATPATLSASNAGSDSPTVAIDPRGDAIVVWEQYVGKDMVKASTHAAGATSWGGASTLSDPTREAESPQVAIDPAGEAVVVFTGQDAAGDKIVQASAEQGFGGEWGAPIALSAAGADSHRPTIGIDAAGEAFVAWDRPGLTTEVVQESRRPAGAGWSTPVTISSPAQEAVEPIVGVDAKGDLGVVWSHYGGVEIAQVTTRLAGGSWSAPRDLTGAGENAYRPRIALDAQGDATVVWNHGTLDGAYTVRQAASAAGSGTWSAPADVSPTLPQEPEPSLAVDPDGDAVVAWRAGQGATEGIEAAARKGVAGAWSPAVAISTPGIVGTEARVGIDDAGHGVALWRNEDANDQGVRTSNYDPGFEGAPAPVVGGEAGTAAGSTGGSSATGAVAPGPPSAAPAAPPAVTPKTTCPNGKALRKVKVAVKAKGRRGARTKTVMRCVKPARRHKRHAKHHRPKGS